MENIMSMSGEELYAKALEFKNLDYDNYFIHIVMAANLKHPEAMHYFHEDCYLKKNLKQNHAKTIIFYEATKNFSYSMTYLGIMHDLGINTERNYQKAGELYTIAIQQGNVIAMAGLAQLYESGYGVEHNYPKAIKLYTRVIEQERDFRYPRVYVMCRLANIYINGYGTKINYSKAMELLICAMERGSKIAIYKLALLYLDGLLGVERNHTRATELYIQFVEQHERELEIDPTDPSTMCDLAVAYTSAPNFGFEPKYDKAIALFNKANDMESNNAIILCNLGTMYENGYGIEKNYDEAIKFYNRAITIAPNNEQIASMFKSLSEKISFQKATERYILPFENLYKSILQFFDQHIQENIKFDSFMKL